MGEAVDEGGKPRRIRPVLLVLLWVWAACIFVVVDLFRNVSEFDDVRPRSKLYEGMREAAHELSGERYDRPAEFETAVAVRRVSRDEAHFCDLLARCIAAPDSATANALASAAASIGPALSDEARVTLSKLLFDIEPPELRAPLGRALGACEGDAELAAYLVSRMDGLDIEHTLPALCTALEGIGVEAVVPDLLGRVERAQGLRKQALIGVIGGIGGAQAERALIELLAVKELDQATRFAVVSAWPTGGASRLASAIEDVPPVARASAVQILGRTRDERYVPVVLDVLTKSKDNAVIRNSLRALGQLGDKAAVERLLAVLNAPDGVYAEAAQEAMQFIRNAKSLELIAGHWEKLNTTGRSAVLLAVAELPEPTDALRVLALRSLVAKEMRVRTAAAWALGRRGADDAVEPLGHYLLRAETDDDRLACVQALSRIESKAAANAGLEGLGKNPGERDLSEYVTLFERLTMNG